MVNWAMARFQNVWTERYPAYWHLIDLFCGIVIGVAFAVLYDAPVGVKIGLGFAVTVIGYLIAFAFTYGIVRSRNGWSKKRK